MQEYILAIVACISNGALKNLFRDATYATLMDDVARQLGSRIYRGVPVHTKHMWSLIMTSISCLENSVRGSQSFLLDDHIRYRITIILSEQLNLEFESVACIQVVCMELL